MIGGFSDGYAPASVMPGRKGIHNPVDSDQRHFYTHVDFDMA